MDIESCMDAITLEVANVAKQDNPSAKTLAELLLDVTVQVGVLCEYLASTQHFAGGAGDHSDPSPALPVDSLRAHHLVTGDVDGTFTEQETPA